MKEIKVEICISGDDISENQVTDSLIDLCEFKGWYMGGGITALPTGEVVTKEDGQESCTIGNSIQQEKAPSMRATVIAYIQLPTHRQIEIWGKLGYGGKMHSEPTIYDANRKFFDWVKENNKQQELILLLLNSDKNAQECDATKS